jgi:hypothetical protein
LTGGTARVSGYECACRQNEADRGDDGRTDDEPSPTP